MTKAGAPGTLTVQWDGSPSVFGKVARATVHKWNPRERAELTDELDAAFFLLYGIGRDDAAYILSTFRRAARGDDETGMFGSPHGILEAYDRLAAGGAASDSA